MIQTNCTWNANTVAYRGIQEGWWPVVSAYCWVWCSCGSPTQERHLGLAVSTADVVLRVRLEDSITSREGSLGVKDHHRTGKTTVWNANTELSVLYEGSAPSYRAATSCFVSRVISIDELVRTCESTLYICQFQPQHWQLLSMAVVFVNV